MTLYEVLGVHATAQPEVIEAAWKVLMKKFHPDAATPDLELTQKINAAHDVLADPAKRKAYDAQLRDSERFKQPESFPGFGFPFENPGAQQAYPAAYPAAYPQPRGTTFEHVIHNAAERIAQVAFESLIEQMPPSVQQGIKNAIRYGKKRRAG